MYPTAEESSGFPLMRLAKSHTHPLKNDFRHDMANQIYSLLKILIEKLEVRLLGINLSIFSELSVIHGIRCLP